MTDNTKHFKMVERVVKSAGTRAGDSDEYDLAHLAQIVELAQAELKRAVQLQKADGKSWADVGAALGITRQAAHKRFSK